MFLKSSLHAVSDMRTNWQQEGAMFRTRTKYAGCNLGADLAGMVALTVLLYVGLYLPHLV